MVKQSHAYAVGRVRVLERGLFGKTGLDRLLATQTPEELYRTLAELGWGDASSQWEVERLAAWQVEQACDLVRRHSPEPEVTDSFLIEYDVHNLKTLFKARELGITEPQGLSPNGLIPVELLRECVRNARYDRIDIPELAQSASRLESLLIVGVDPLEIDAELDRGMYRFIARNLKKSRNVVMKQYFSDRADMTNILIVLRARQMGRDAAFAQPLLVTGGQLDQAAVLSLLEDVNKLDKVLVGKPYAAQMRKGLAAYQAGSGLALMEKLREDYLLSLIRPHRYEPLSVLPLVGYLLAREREAAAVRLILSARLSGFPSAQLTERLRDGYAG